MSNLVIDVEYERQQQKFERFTLKNRGKAFFKVANAVRIGSGVDDFTFEEALHFFKIYSLPTALEILDTATLNTRKITKSFVKKAFQSFSLKQRHEIFARLQKEGLVKDYIRGISENRCDFPISVERELTKWVQDNHNLETTADSVIDFIIMPRFIMAGEDLSKRFSHFNLTVPDILNTYVRLIGLRRLGDQDLTETQIPLAKMRDVIDRSFDNMSTDDLLKFFDTFTDGYLWVGFVHGIHEGTCLWPENIQTAFTVWAADRMKRDLAAEAALNPDADPTPAMPVYNDINIVKVDDLLPPGEQEDMGAPGQSRRPVGEDGQTRVQPRIDWLVKRLASDGFLHSEITIYEERKIEGRNPKVNPYIVLEAREGDRHFQVAICQTVGHATFIIRTPFDPTDTSHVMTVAELRQREDVYAIRCYGENQWTNGVIRYASLSLTELGYQLKTKIGWGDKAPWLLDTLENFYTEFGQLPMASDTSIVEHGSEGNPLIGRTTWLRAYNALQNGAIPGLEGQKTFRDVLEAVHGPLDLAARRGARVVQMAKIEPPPPAPVIVDARAIFHDAANGIVQSRSVPLQLATYSHADINRAFAEKTVTNLADVVPDDGLDGLTCCDQFLAAAGLGETRDGRLVVSSAAIVRVLIKHVPLPLAAPHSL